MNDYPLIKFVLLFICGIVLQSVLSILLIPLLISFLASLVLMLFFYFMSSRKESFLNLSLICISVILYGMIHYSLHKNVNVAYPFDLPVNKNALIFGSVTDVNLIRKDKVVFQIETDSVKLNERTAVGCINLICSVKDSMRNLEKFYSSVQIGNRLAVKGTLSRARNQRNPGEFDYESALAQKGIHGLINVYKTGDISILSQESSALKNIPLEIRKSIDGLITKYHNNSTTALLRGLLLADRSMIDYDIRTEFINSGVVHVLAVSGLHVGFVVLIFVVIFKRFNPYIRYGFTILGLLFFMVITNYPTSVVRATIMALVMIASPLTGRNYNSINSLSLAALIILLLYPSEIFSPGFQLSFSAVLSIVLLYPPIASRIAKMKIKSAAARYILLFCAVSFAAQIGTLPFTLFYFHKLSVIALFANFIVIPMIGLIVGLGIFTIFTGSILSILGMISGSANELLSFILFSIVRFFGNENYSFIFIRQFSLIDSLLFYGIVTSIFLTWKYLVSIRSRIIVAVLSILIVIMGFSLDNRELLKDNILSLYVIDIGQGDAILIKFPNGRTALIDGGDATETFDNGSRVIIPLLDHFGIGKIDYGFITHADADHYRGYISLIKNNRISQICKPVPDFSEPGDIEIEEVIKTHRVPVNYFAKNIISIGNVRMYILNDTIRFDFKNLSMNDKSGVFKIVYGKTSFLFTGDAGIKAENFYIHYYAGFLKSDVLKAGHHGSKTSSGEKFLDAVKPDYALISAGIMNKFRHPSPEIIERLNKRRIEIHRTDLSGGILFQSDGYRIKNINWKKE